ncbi:MAG: hypothetical protein AB1465_00595 [Patescibacteria group bacterium]
MLNNMCYNINMAKHPPKSLQGYLWSVDVKHLDVESDKVYIIHQILVYGDFEALKWLFENYSLKEITEVFIKYPQKIYPKNIFNFVKNFILPLGDLKLDEDKYVTSIFGKIRPRAPAKGFFGNLRYFQKNLFWLVALL